MRSFHGRFLVITAVLAVASLGEVAHAQQATPAPQVLPELMVGTTGFMVQASHGGSIPDPGEQSSCSARCADGSYVNCSGTNCSAYDASCGTGFKGYCTGTSSGRKDCTASCGGGTVCSESLTCANGYQISCSSSGANDCMSFHDCWVYCDGQYTLCPDAGTCPV